MSGSRQSSQERLVCHCLPGRSSGRLAAQAGGERPIRHLLWWEGPEEATPGVTGVTLPSRDATCPPGRSGRRGAPPQTLAVVGGA
ncbi:hypothetical protein EI555_005485 [Monodon monoceros]|uniref:Uncharacterized protein n=1 Tax=Monodon monoceros TaxID=40151 RepID=A0A4U1ECF8_MONMO|nr:hypothetical protein EI555_005485 [Monodon monoceros]